jgi:hypothetical protein
MLQRSIHTETPTLPVRLDQNKGINKSRIDSKGTPKLGNIVCIVRRGLEGKVSPQEEWNVPVQVGERISQRLDANM